MIEVAVAVAVAGSAVDVVAMFVRDLMITYFKFKSESVTGFNCG